MSDWITEEDMDRIQEFAETPRYRREPEQLVPDDSDGGQTGEATAD